MDPKVKTNLLALGLNPDDYENCPEFALLEDILLNIDEGNILSEEEVEALELASFIAVDDIPEKLKEHGVDEDEIWETQESVIENLQKKLRQLDSLSHSLDHNIDTLRNEKRSSMRIEKELNEKLEAVRLCLNSHISECGEKWNQIQCELQKLFEEFQNLNSIYDDKNYVDDFEEFLKIFKKELEIFTSNVNQYVDAEMSWMKVDTSQKKPENVCNESNQTQGIQIPDVSNLEQRLTISNFHNNFLNIKIGESDGFNGDLKMLTQLFPQSKLSNFPAENIDLKEWESIYNDILSLSVKQAQFQIKDEGIFQHLKFIKALRESRLECSENLLKILEKHHALLDLVSIVWFLWNKGNNDIREGLNYCYLHFQEEVANRSARIACLEDSKKKFELYLNESFNKNNPYQQMLDKIPSQDLSPIQQNLPDLITLLKDKLEQILCQQSLSKESSKKQLARIDKQNDEILEYVNRNLENLAEITDGFNTANRVIQMHKERRMDVLTQIAQDSPQNIRRLLWVKFLTDAKNLKEHLEAIPENIPETPSFKDHPRFTSTPKGDE